MAKIMEMKSINPKLKQSETAKEMKISTTTTQRYRREKNMAFLIENQQTLITQENERLQNKP